MTTKIRKLTAAQEAAMPAWAEKWIAIGLSTEPADRKRAEAAYRACYRAAKLKDDIPLVWVTSPIVGALAAPIAAIMLNKKRGSAVGSAVDSAVDSAVRSAVRSAVDSAVRSAVDSAVRSAVDSAVGRAVGSAVYSAVDSAVRSAVYRAVGSAVGSAVDSAVDSAVRSAVRSAVDSAVGRAVGSAVGSAVYRAVGSAVGSANLFWHSWIGGSMWSYWGAFESFFREECDLKYSDEIERAAIAYGETCMSGCYWWPNKDFIVACERPCFIKRDNRGLLHSEDSQAIEWPDGWGLFMWHGIRVPGDWIMNRVSLTPEIALSQQNTEQRRAACEILGWPKILSKLNARMIDKDPDPEIGELLEVDLPDAPRERFLRVRCGTGREFVLWTAKTVKTALEANALSYGITSDLLKLKEHRT